MFKKTFLALFSLTFFQCSFGGGSNEEDSMPLDQIGFPKDQNTKEPSIINATHNIFSDELIKLETDLTKACDDNKLEESKNEVLTKAKSKTIKTLMGVIVGHAISKARMQDLIMQDISPSHTDPSNKRFPLWKNFSREQDVEKFDDILSKLAAEYLKMGVIEPEKIAAFQNSWVNVCTQMKEYWVFAENKCSECRKYY